MEKSNQLITSGLVGSWGKGKQGEKVMHAVFSIWSGSLRWLLLFTQTRVQTLHLRRSNITGLLQKATLSHSFFFEGGGLDWDKRIQSVMLGHFLFTPSCCGHNRCIEMIWEYNSFPLLFFSGHLEGQSEWWCENNVNVDRIRLMGHVLHLTHR